MPSIIRKPSSYDYMIREILPGCTLPSSFHPHYGAKRVPTIVHNGEGV